MKIVSTNSPIPSYTCGAGWFDGCRAKMTNRPINETSEALSIGLSTVRIPAQRQTVRNPTADDEEKKAAKIPLPGLSSDSVFRDLRVSALLKARCYVTNGGLVRFQLELSEHPPLGWSYIFLTVWQSVSYPNKARVGMEEDTLWVECDAEEFKDRDFPQIQNAIDETNTQYRTVLQEQIAAEEKREKIDRETLEKILDLDLGLNPRSINKRRSRWLRAYLEPLAWAAFNAAWIIGGLWLWLRIPTSEWSFIREPLLILIWSWILYACAGRSLSQFKQRYRIRKFVLKKRVATVWPEQYTDRRARS